MLLLRLYMGDYVALDGFERVCDMQSEDRLASLLDSHHGRGTNIFAFFSLSPEIDSVRNIYRSRKSQSMNITQSTFPSLHYISCQKYHTHPSIHIEIPILAIEVNNIDNIDGLIRITNEQNAIEKGLVL